MTAQVVRISNEVEIPYLIYSGQPVLTFALIDKAHNRVEGTASRNFRANRKRFIDGKDFYDLPVVIHTSISVPLRFGAGPSMTPPRT